MGCVGECRAEAFRGWYVREERWLYVWRWVKVLVFSRLTSAEQERSLISVLLSGASRAKMREKQTVVYDLCPHQPPRSFSPSDSPSNSLSNYASDSASGSACDSAAELIQSIHVPSRLKSPASHFPSLTSVTVLPNDSNLPRLPLDPVLPLAVPRLLDETSRVHKVSPRSTQDVRQSGGALHVAEQTVPVIGALLVDGRVAEAGSDVAVLDFFWRGRGCVVDPEGISCCRRGVGVLEWDGLGLSIWLCLAFRSGGCVSLLWRYGDQCWPFIQSVLQLECS